MRKASILARKKKLSLTADYRTPLDAQIRCLFVSPNTRDHRILAAFKERKLAHQRLGLERVVFRLRQTDEPVETEAVLKDMKRWKLEPANISELIAFRKQFRRVPGAHRFIALGSPIQLRGRTHVPYYANSEDGLSIKLEPDHSYGNGAWGFGSVFLGVVALSREKLPAPV